MSSQRNMKEHGRRSAGDSERIETVIIGGGQAGLSVGYHLARRGQPFVILDANQRIGDVWRNRWDSLRLFSPARYNGLAGLPFPAPAWSFPSKNEMADYLEAYAARFQLPVRTGVRVDRLSRHDGRLVVAAGERRWEADNVVVAMATWQQPRIPGFARELDPGIVQLHSLDYRNPSQLRDGGVLMVGAGNSGAEIALDAAPAHPTWLSGRDTGHIPFRIDGVAARLLLRLVFRVLFHRVLTTDTPMGRKQRPHLTSQGLPLVRSRSQDLAAAGVERVPRLVGVRDGQPVLADGRVLEVANVIWCTGFDPGFSWIDLPVLGEHDEPVQQRGVVTSQPGLYFVGLHFLYAASSAMIHGVGRDAEHIADAIQARQRGASDSTGPASENGRTPVGTGSSKQRRAQTRTRTKGRS